VTEGNSGSVNAVFNVSLSAASDELVTVDYLTSDGAATSPGDYQFTSGTLFFGPGQTTHTITVPVMGDTASEGVETFFVSLSNPLNASLADGMGVGTINDNDAPVATFGFSAASFGNTEDCGAVVVNVNRTGDTSAAMRVAYATSDGTASERSDYTFASGTLSFAAGETARSFPVLVSEDSRAEGTETLTVTLSNPTGGGALGGQTTATVVIIDDASEPSTNAIDDTNVFICQNYHDFLNRDPDPVGLAFWTNQIAQCGSDQACVASQRVNVSAAFFLSIEFQKTGFLVHRAIRAAFNRLPRYREFIRDTQALGLDVVVGQGNWEQQLEANERQFADEFVARPEFVSIYGGLSDEQYVDALNGNTGGSLSPSERDALVAGLGGMTETRATVLRKVAEDADFAAREVNSAFVLAQYFGYLRRNPNDAPDSDFVGFNFWLAKLNQFGGDFRRAEMVRAFVSSNEYRARFGQ
jgi:hypothetical protein